MQVVSYFGPPAYRKKKYKNIRQDSPTSTENMILHRWQMSVKVLLCWILVSVEKKHRMKKPSKLNAEARKQLYYCMSDIYQSLTPSQVMD